MPDDLLMVGLGNQMGLDRVLADFDPNVVIGAYLMVLTGAAECR